VRFTAWVFHGAKEPVDAEVGPVGESAGEQVSREVLPEHAPLAALREERLQSRQVGSGSPLDASPGTTLAPGELDRGHLERRHHVVAGLASPLGSPAHQHLASKLVVVEDHGVEHLRARLRCHPLQHFAHLSGEGGSTAEARTNPQITQIARANALSVQPARPGDHGSDRGGLSVGIAGHERVIGAVMQAAQRKEVGLPLLIHVELAGDVHVAEQLADGVVVVRSCHREVHVPGADLEQRAHVGSG
jgi:hypothetical protein